MATNVYGNGTNSTAGVNTITHYYDRAGIRAANRVNVYGQWADKKSQPTKMGKTFKVSKFLHMYDRAQNDGDFAGKGYLTARSAADVSAALTGATLSEGAGAVNKKSISKVTVEATLARYGEMIDYTDEVELFSEDSMQVKYREELGELANSREEDLIQLDMLGTGTVLYSGTATSKIGVDTKISYDLVRKGVRKLVRNRAKKNTSIVTGSTKVGTAPVAKAYYGIIGADVKSDLESITRGTDGAKEFTYQPAHKYAGAASLAEGEVGAMHEVRFIEAEGAVVYRGEGSGVISDTQETAATTIVSSAVQNTGAAATTTYTTGNDNSAERFAAILAARGSVVYVDASDSNNIKEATVIGDTDIGGTGSDVLINEYFDAYPILFPTEGSFATVGLKGKGKIKFNSKAPDAVELSNPYGTQGFFSYNFWYAGLILQEEKLLKILVAASV